MLFTYIDHSSFWQIFFGGVKCLDYVSVNFLSGVELISSLTVPYILFFSLGLKILLSLFMFHVFVFRFIKTSAVIASAPELDVPTRILYFDKMISTLEELQTGKNNLQTFFFVLNPFADFSDY